LSASFAPATVTTGTWSQKTMNRDAIIFACATQTKRSGDLSGRTQGGRARVIRDGPQRPSNQVNNVLGLPGHLPAARSTVRARTQRGDD